MSDHPYVTSITGQPLFSWNHGASKIVGERNVYTYGLECFSEF